VLMLSSVSHLREVGHAEVVAKGEGALISPHQPEPFHHARRRHLIERPDPGRFGGVVWLGRAQSQTPMCGPVREVVRVAC
jgi:hypothetical protein